jgi:hypothetical protein
LDDNTAVAVRADAADLEWAQFALDNAIYDLRDKIMAAISRGIDPADLAEASGMTTKQLQVFLRPQD